jgi:hypothetical protein
MFCKEGAKFAAGLLETVNLSKHNSLAGWFESKFIVAVC